MCFRQNTKKIAESLDLKGFVRNRPDNSVEIIVKGTEKDIKEFMAWCKKGPSAAEVEKVNIKEIEQKKEFHTFEIKYT